MKKFIVIAMMLLAGCGSIQERPPELEEPPQPSRMGEIGGFIRLPEGKAFVLVDYDPMTMGPNALSNINAHSSVSTGDFITATIWNTNFDRIEDWINGSLVGENNIGPADIATGGVTTTEVLDGTLATADYADSSIQAREYNTRTTSQDALTEGSMNTIIVNESGDTQITVVTAATEKVVIQASFLFGRNATRADGDHVQIKVLRDGSTAVGEISGFTWGGSNSSQPTHTFVIFKYEEISAGTYTYEFQLDPGSGAGTIDLESLYSLIYVDKGK